MQQRRSNAAEKKKKRDSIFNLMKTSYSHIEESGTEPAFLHKQLKNCIKYEADRAELCCLREEKQKDEPYDHLSFLSESDLQITV